MNNKSKHLARQDFTWELDGKYYHLIKMAVQDNAEIFIHLISKNKQDVWTDGELMKLPDHISYHKDGRVHIKHKGGERTILPFRFKEALLNTQGLVNLPFLTISFYKNRFEMYKSFLTPLDKQPTNHSIIKAKDSFTLIFTLKDLTNIPCQQRQIKVDYKYGCMPIEKEKLPALEDGDRVSPIINVCLNPDKNLINQLNVSDILITKKQTDV
jgi:hypothetical protein